MNDSLNMFPNIFISIIFMCLSILVIFMIVKTKKEIKYYEDLMCEFDEQILDQFTLFLNTIPTNNITDYTYIVLSPSEIMNEYNSSLKYLIKKQDYWIDDWYRYVREYCVPYNRYKHNYKYYTETEYTLTRRTCYYGKRTS